MLLLLRKFTKHSLCVLILVGNGNGFPDAFQLYLAYQRKEEQSWQKQKIYVRKYQSPSTPNAEANHNLLDLANSLWFELKEDLYHTFSFISRHFSPEVLQNVYDLCGDPKNGFLPWELLGAAIYLQTGTPPPETRKDEWNAEWKELQILSTPQSPDTISSMGSCTVREHGKETRFYTIHFGQFDPLELLSKSEALAKSRGITVTEAMQQIDYDMQLGYVTADKAVCGPESIMAEKLSQLMSTSPIAAAHITIDVDGGSIQVKKQSPKTKTQPDR